MLSEGEIPVKTKQSIVYELEPKITHLIELKKTLSLVFLSSSEMLF